MISCSAHNDLIMDLSGLVNHPCKMFITSWDKGMQWSGLNDGVFEEYGRLENPGIPFSLLAAAPGSAPWQARIPAGLMPRLLEFEEFFPDLIFSAMWFLSRYPASINLLVSSPRLLALILQSAKDEGWDEQAIVQLFSAQKSEILAACDAQRAKAGWQAWQRSSVKQCRRNRFRQAQQTQEWAYPGMGAESRGFGSRAAEAAA